MNIKTLYQQSASNDWKNAWIMCCAFAIIIGMYVSSALMSIGMIATALLLFTPGALAQIKINFKAQPLYVLFVGVFMFYLISGLYSENMDYWAERLQIKLPYLLLPFSFAALTLSQKTLYRILYFFYITVLLGALGSLINFALNYEAILKSYLYAKTLPTPFEIGHIRFSLMSAFSVFIGWVLYRDRFYVKWQWERYLILTGTVVLFIFLHVLSVRSGLLALYVGVLTYVFFETLSRHGVKRMLITLCLFALIPVGMYIVSPTLKNKVDYMIRDVSHFKDGKNINDYSDANRMLSWQLAWRIGNENPLLGVGIGDVRNKIDHIYEVEYPYSIIYYKNGAYAGSRGVAPQNRLIPHSQFMYIFAGCGWLGLIWFAMLSIYPFLDSRLRKSSLTLTYTAIMATSFLSEATLEIQLGVTLHLFVSLLLLSNMNSVKQA